MSMIPNPKKNVVVDFTLIDCKNAIKKIPSYFKQKYTLEKQNDILNQTTFGALEFLSLGVFIDVNLNSISETKTDIIVEVRRKLGAFDTWVEVSKANRHLDDLFNGISALLMNVRKAAMTIETANPISVIKYDLCWVDVKRHLKTFLLTYPNTYKLVSEDSSSDTTILRRLPQAGDDVVLSIDAIINITKVSTTENSSEVRYEITNDNNKISTQGELQRNTLILKITINLLQKIINDLKNKIAQAEAELVNIQKWKMGRSDKEKQEQIEKQTNIINELKLKLKSS
jgi:hypothetical protein